MTQIKTQVNASTTRATLEHDDAGVDQLIDALAQENRRLATNTPRAAINAQKQASLRYSQDGIVGTAAAGAEPRKSEYGR
jgi:hypothetical protein